MTFQYSTLHQFHAQLLSGHTTITQAVSHYLQQIETQKHLNAFVEVFNEDAMADAQAMDAAIANGSRLLPLQGLVIGIKDVICIANKTISAASKMLANHKPIYDATVIKRLKAAGAVIIGTCNCDEFAMGSTNENSAYGPVLNAMDNTKVPGGSSGGSAVAVQAQLCMASLGSDTGGSIRQPADFCGIWGFKPTYGAISRYGLISYASSFDSIGIFGNNAADIYGIYQVIAGADGLDGTCILPEQWAKKPLESERKSTYNIAVPEPMLTMPGLDAEIKASIEATIASLKNAGHRVDFVPFDLLDYIVPTYYILTTAEASSNLGRFDGVRYGLRVPEQHNEKLELTDFYCQNRSAGFGWEVKRRIMLGSFVLSAGYFDAYFNKAQQVRTLLYAQTNDIFEQYDAILMPVSPTTAFGIGEKMEDPISMYLADIYTVFANLVGIAGMAVPTSTHSNGMPFGVQVLTKPGEELTLHHISTVVANTANV